MNQKLSWPMALAGIGALLLLLLVMYYRSSFSSGSQARISPGFQQLSPQEQKAALESAARARMRRGGTQ